MHYSFLLFFTLLQLHVVNSQSQANHIRNGGFDFPALSPNTYVRQLAQGWTGRWFELCRNPTYNGNLNQFIDMTAIIGQNGYIEQQITLNYTCNCTLHHQQKAFSTNFASYVIEIYWNYDLLTTKRANTTSITIQTLYLKGLAGVNVLKFKQIGLDSDGFGMWLDEITLTCIQIPPTPPAPNLTDSTQPTLPIQEESADLTDLSLLATYRPFPTDQAYSASAILAIPIKSKSALKLLYIYFNDLWLYNYDKRDHYGVVNDIFNTITLLQLMKFRFLENFLGLAKYSSRLSLSNYTDYTLAKFIKIEGSESVLITSNFTFFIYTIPQQILICLVLYALFIMMSDKKISRYFRVFYFFRAVLSQSLIQENLSYFTYVCFSHLSHPFSYGFPDKISLTFSSLFLLLIVTYTFTFYFLFSEYLKKNSGYFMLCFYRQKSSSYMLTTKILARSLIQGIAHLFLHNYYGCMLLVLSCTEIVVILSMILLELNKKIFLSKLSFCLQLIYHFTFILFNFSLYFQLLCSSGYEDYNYLRTTALKMQQVYVYALIIDSFLIFANELIPKKCSKVPVRMQKEYVIQASKIKDHKKTMKKRMKSVDKGKALQKNFKNQENIENIFVRDLNTIAKNPKNSILKRPSSRFVSCPNE